MANPIPELPKGSTAVNVANAAAMAVDIGTGIATTIASISDDKKRTAFQQNLQLLSNDQQIALSKALNNANNEQERLKILGLALTNLSSQRINNLQEIISQQEKNKRTQLITNAIKFGALIIVGGVIIYLVIRKD
jgi:transcriptional regulatory protein LevR